MCLQEFLYYEGDASKEDIPRLAEIGNSGYSVKWAVRIK